MPDSHLLTAGCRVSSLGNEASPQVILPDANILLGTTTPRSSAPPRETTEGLLRARVSPFCYHMAHRVGASGDNFMFSRPLTGHSRWSYLVNMTLMGNAVFLSMDFPDTALAVSPYHFQRMMTDFPKVSKLLNYMQREFAKTVTFAGLLVAWTYFRIYLNLNILRSIWFEFDLIPCVAPPLSFACLI